MAKWIFLKKHAGQQWYPKILFCKHRGVGNPPIQQTKIHPSRHPLNMLDLKQVCKC